MKIGTRSLLFGVHQVFIHPLFVALAWWKLYGFPKSWKLWVCFVVHDWGYFGLNEMDGPIGDLHPYHGASIARRWLDEYEYTISPVSYHYHTQMRDAGWDIDPQKLCFEGMTHWRRKRKTWHDFCLYHSRFLAKRNGRQPSKLCMADKLAVGLEPWWTYIPRAWLSGELKVYMKSAESDGKHGHMRLDNVSPIRWYKSVQAYLVRYTEEHKDSRADTITMIDRSDQV